MTTELVLLEVADAVAHVRLNRQAASNALSVRMCNELLGVLGKVGALAGEGEVRAATLEGGPRAFCAGADLKERANMNPVAMSAHSKLIADCADQIASLPCPTIAAVQGAALGGGLELALACDLRIVATDAVLGFPEIKFGFFPGAGGPVRLVRLVGYAVATDLLLTGRSFNGEEAVSLHVAHKVVAAGGVRDAAYAQAHALAPLPTSGVMALRTLLADMDRQQVHSNMVRARELRDALNGDAGVDAALKRFATAEPASNHSPNAGPREKGSSA